MIRFLRRLGHGGALWVVSCLAVWVLSGCKPAEPGYTEAKSSDSVSVTVDSINYMHERGVKYTLYDLAKSPPLAVGGAIVYMLGTGGEKGCCVALPKIWKPGMMLRVVWSEADRQQTFPGEYTRDLEVPRYDTPADLYVVFYAGQKVELVVSEGEPGHPEWRGSVKETPWEACLANNERKVCKAALPKQFDTKSYQGFCPEALRERWKDAEEACRFMTQQCLKDYEDESFCKGVLWGEKK
ncbi:DUF3304 domain-containing protein [Sphaerotilaceae bacterium SBD11-9]